MRTSTMDKSSQAAAVCTHKHAYPPKPPTPKDKAQDDAPVVSG